MKFYHGYGPCTTSALNVAFCYNVDVLATILEEKIIMASKSLRLDAELVDAAMLTGKVKKRSAAKQVEYWASLGRAAKENPDLPIDFIEELLEAEEERKHGLLAEYNFG
ncbi:TA system antitoxin ParD family protein [Candidatus Sororendozoicomonas aggregata]|uniref:TA system antitoxin ParD family protein n=1 Tax=Candidatus Sororendozoicomonas aggregata TaxID=3073239 RepID=UPI002ED06C16